jgi:hypothetical protein
MTTWRGYGRGAPITGFAAVLIVVWLIIGAIAAGQGNYYRGSTTCAKAGTIALTIVTGPLNYVGLNPKISCHAPQPSK